MKVKIKYDIIWIFNKISWVFFVLDCELIKNIKEFIFFGIFFLDII